MNTFNYNIKENSKTEECTINLNNKVYSYTKYFPDQSIKDERIAEIYKFESGFEVLIIQDSRVDKFGASMNVKIGSALDPENLPGLAHFLEHMLFMGTDDFPVENDFDLYLSKHSGSTNAFTDFENTCYHFETSSEGFEGGLHRFSRFFINPLLMESSVKREVKSVHSEYSNTLTDDNWRLYQAQLSEINPKSIMNKFTMGCNKSLLKKDVNLRDEAFNFYKKYYKPAVMTLVLITNKDISEMQQLIFKYYEALFDSKLNILENGSIITNDFLSKIISNDNLMNKPFADEYSNISEIYLIKPISSICQMNLEWVLYENHMAEYKSPPLRVINTILGHEGKHSLAYKLKQRDLITDLVSSYSANTSVYCTVTLTFKLTNKGLENWLEVLALTYKYLNMMKTIPINERYYEEIRRQSWYSFTFNDSIDPSVGELAEEMASYFTNFNGKDIFTRGNFLQALNHEIISKLKKYLSWLTYENMNIIFLTKNNTNINYTEFPINNETKKLDYKIEQWYKVKYCKSKSKVSQLISDIQLISDKETKVNFNYPEENIFVSNDCEIKDDNLKNVHPICLASSSLSTVWFKQDYSFKFPKVIICFKIFLNTVQFEYKKYKNIFYIILQLVKDELMDLTYIASEAELTADFDLAFNGITFEFSGFSDKISFFTQSFIKEFTRVIIDLSNKFQNDDYCKTKLLTKIEEIIREKKIILCDKPKDQCQLFLNLLLFEKASHVLDDVNYIQDIFNNELDSDDDSESSSNPDSDEDNSDSEVSKSSKLSKKKNEEVSEEEEVSNDEEEEDESIHSKIKKQNLPKINDFVDILSKVFTQMKFLWHIQGNITSNQAIELVNNNENELIKLLKNDNISIKNIEKDFESTITPIQIPKVINIIDKEISYNYIYKNYEAEEKNHSNLIYFQLEENNLENSVITQLIVNLFSESFFDTLRTKEQIGYNVSCYKTIAEKINGIVFLVQSNKLSSTEISYRIEHFIKSRITFLKNSEEKLFEEYINSYINDLEVRFVNLREEVEYYWNIITKNDEMTLLTQKINFLKSKNVNKSTILQLINRLFFENLKKLEIHVVPNNFNVDDPFKKLKSKELKEEEKEEVNNFLNRKRLFISSIDDFKAKNCYFNFDK